MLRCVAFVLFKISCLNRNHLSSILPYSRVLFKCYFLNDPKFCQIFPDDVYIGEMIEAAKSMRLFFKFPHTIHLH